MAVQIHPSPARPHHLVSAGVKGGTYVRVGSTNRRADDALVAEMQRFARGEAFDERAMPGLDSEAIDFRAASESFVPIRRLAIRGQLMSVVFLDTETTGLSAAAGDRIVELAIVDAQGRPILDTLVNPERPIPQSARTIHGISDAMVRSAPTLSELWPDILRVLSGSQVVIYNAAYDREFLPDRLKCAKQVSCAMLRFAEARGQWNPRYGNYRWHRLEDAARHVGHVWTGAAHRALADAQACRSVWTWLDKRR